MTDLDDDALLVARLFHLIECPPSPMPYSRFGERHRTGHNRKAKQFLAGLRNAGKTLTDIKEA